MPILFAVVARGATVLAKYASCAGNFTEVTEQILSKIPADNSKLTYSHSRYNIKSCDFQQCGILTSVDSDKPVQPPFKLRNSK